MRSVSLLMAPKSTYTQSQHIYVPAGQQWTTAGQGMRAAVQPVALWILNTVHKKTSTKETKTCFKRLRNHTGRGQPFFLHRHMHRTVHTSSVGPAVSMALDRKQ